MRYFFWLAALLTGYFVIQSILLLFINLHQLRSGVPVGAHSEFWEWFTMTSVGAVLLPLVLVIAWRVARRMLRPLRQIAESAKRIADGRQEERIVVEDTHDEIASLAGTLNQAFENYRQSVHRLEQFASTASHQLRTPLTALRSTGEVALQRPRTAAEHAETISTMLEEAERLSRIVEQLLLLARLGNEEVRRTFIHIDMGELIRSTIREFDVQRKEKHIRITYESEGSLPIPGHAALLEQALSNILDNAIRHTPEHGRIEIHSIVESGGIHILVSDTGPGFESGPALPPSGTGLGLSIVENIARLHNGVMSVARSKNTGGAEVRLTLPTTTKTIG